MRRSKLPISELLLRYFAGTMVLAAILALVGGYMGWLHGLGDSLAVGRPYAVMGLFCASALASLAGMRVASFASTLLALICGLQVFLAFSFGGPPGRITLYQKNMLFRNGTLEALEEDIRAAGAMVVTLQEVSERNQTMLAALADLYPHQQICPWGAVGGTAVLSSLPMVEGTEFCAPGLAAMQLVDGAREFWLVSVHLHWPWPYDQTSHVRKLLPVLAKFDGPVVMAGDFNMVVWAQSVQRLSAITGTMAAGPTMGSYIGFAPWLNLPIDHVFAPAGGRVNLRPAAGSDHLGLFAKVDL